MLVPNAALRFLPPRQAAGQASAARAGRAGSRTAAGGRPQPVPVTIGLTDGCTPRSSRARPRARGDGRPGGRDSCAGGGRAAAEVLNMTVSAAVPSHRGARPRAQAMAPATHVVRALRGVSLDVPRASSSRSWGRPARASRRYEHPRLPRPPDARAATCSTASTCRELTRDELARSAQPEDRLRLPELQPAAAHERARERRAAAALRRRASARAAARARCAALERVGLGGARATTGRASSRAGSSSASRSRARWSTSRASSWPTSRPATSTRARSVEIMALFQRAEPRRASRSCSSRTSPTSRSYARRDRRVPRRPVDPT